MGAEPGFDWEAEFGRVCDRLDLSNARACARHERASSKSKKLLQREYMGRVVAADNKVLKEDRLYNTENIGKVEHLVENLQKHG